MGQGGSGTKLMIVELCNVSRSLWLNNRHLCEVSSSLVESCTLEPEQVVTSALKRKEKMQSENWTKR